MEINELQKVIIGFFCEKFPAKPGEIIPQYAQITDETVFPNKVAKELAKLVGLEYGPTEPGDSIRTRLDELVKATMGAESITIPEDFMPKPTTPPEDSLSAPSNGVITPGTDSSAISGTFPPSGEPNPGIPPAVLPTPPAPGAPEKPAPKVVLMPDCRSFSLERYCDAGKKTVNCCGPHCRQYNSKPKPVAAILIEQFTKKTHK